MRLEDIFEKYRDKYCRFLDAMPVNDWLYFSSADFDGLFRMKIGGNEAEYLGAFPDELPRMINMHKEIIKTGNSLYFIPYAGFGIGKYDIDNQKFKHINIGNVIHKEHFIIASYSLGEEQVLIPRDFSNNIFVLNTKDDSVREKANFASLLHENIENNAYIDDFGIYEGNNNIFFAINGTNRLYSMSKSDFSVKRISIADENLKISGIFLFENCLWFCENPGNGIARLDLESHEFYRYDKIISVDDTRPFERFFEYKNNLYAIPFEKTGIYKYEKAADEWQLFFDISEIAGLHKKFYSTIFYGFQISNGKLILYPKTTDSGLVIDMDTLQCQKYSVSKRTIDISKIEESYDPLIASYMSRHFNKRGPIIYEDIYDTNPHNLCQYLYYEC